MSNVTSSTEFGSHAVVSDWPFQEMTSEQWHVWSGLHWIPGHPSPDKIHELKGLIPIPGDRFDEILKELEHRGYIVRLNGSDFYLPGSRPAYMEHMASEFKEYEHE